jgi:hypothetical protein
MHVTANETWFNLCNPKSSEAKKSVSQASHRPGHTQHFAFRYAEGLAKEPLECFRTFSILSAKKVAGAAFKFYSPTLHDEGLAKEPLEYFRTFSIPPPKKVGGMAFKFYSPTACRGASKGAALVFSHNFNPLEQKGWGDNV